MLKLCFSRANRRPSSCIWNGQRHFRATQSKQMARNHQEVEFDSIQLLKKFGFESQDIASLGFTEREIDVKANPEQQTLLQERLKVLKQEITEAGDQPNCTVDEALKILEQLSTSPIGKGLILHGTWDQDDIVAMTLVDEEQDFKADQLRTILSLVEMSPFQKTLMATPSVQGMQFRGDAAKDHLHRIAKEGSMFCCYPSGIIDFREFSSLELKNFDIHIFCTSDESIREKQQAAKLQLFENTQFEPQKTFWHDRYLDTFDVVLTNGFDIFASEPNVMGLLRNFLAITKPGGVFLLSAFAPKEQQNLSEIGEEALKLEDNLNRIFKREGISASTVSGWLQDAGWTNIQISEGSIGSVPTFLAYKPEEIPT